MVLPKDPLKIDEYLRKLRENSLRLAQDPKYRDKRKEISQKLAKDPEWLRKNREMIQNRSQNPIWRSNQTVGAQKRVQNPSWQYNHRQVLQNLSKTNAQNPDWKLKQKEGKIGGFWYGNVRYPDRPIYCELWNRNLWHRIDEAQGYQSILSGKTKFENGGHALDRHHVYWQKKACCEWDEDTQGYYAMINVGTRKYPNYIKYYIPGDPNKFVLLTRSEHQIIKKDKLKWIKIFEDLIETKLDGVCYLPKVKA